MVRALHALIYSDDAVATRKFFRDVLGYRSTELSEGWLVFDSGPSELAVHPTKTEWEGKTYTNPRHHSISLICDDLTKTMQELEDKGATFTTEPKDEGFGLYAMMALPGADDIMVYEPTYPVAFPDDPA